MSANSVATLRNRPALKGQIVVVIGGSGGIGLETARRAGDAGAELILAARNPERLDRAGNELGALRTAAFDASDTAAVDQFFRELPDAVDHVMLTAGRPYYAPLVDMDFAEARRVLGDLLLPLQVARFAGRTVRRGGSVLFLGGY